ncbi:MAG: thiol:disulfide interchange protein, partial [Muribaculaceae bacterium]|nr:thiol:disulfide interchange protein [Muribaculaceae bacterium]
MACNATSCTSPAHVDFTLPFGNTDNIVEEKPAETTQPVATVTTKPSASTADNTAWWEPVDADFNQENSVSNSSWWSIFIIGFLGGLLALLTPCVWPMIPMTVSFFLKTTKNRRKSIANAITYGLSIVVIFLVLGMAITLIFGASKLNELSTSAVFNLIFFA